MTARASFTPPTLQERFDGFSYDYRMRCSCGGAVDVDAETYYRQQSVEARVPCDRCGGQVHFGPAVALLRDEDDPALGDVMRFAWYHTSTWRNWPSDDHQARTEAAVRHTAELFRLDAERMVQQATTKALHLGTYEAAIENMLRRMCNQDDGTSQFFLYRVAIHVAPGRINEGYRDENDESAAQLTIADLDQAGLDSVRYLNVHEATGSLSLAVRPACIVATQCIPIPVERLRSTPAVGLSARLVEIEAEIEYNAHEQANAPKLDQRRLAGDLERRGYRLWADLESALSDGYLCGISPVVADDFRSAVATRRRRGDKDGVKACAEHFAVLASLLTRPREVVQLVSRQPWRHMKWSVPFQT